MKRRTVLKIGAASLLGSLANPAFSKEKNEQSCIFIYLEGGISQIETFSPIQNSPIEFRSTTDYIRTNIPEISLGGSFANLSFLADKFNIVKSYGHRDHNHNSAQHEVLTSTPSPQVLDGAPQKEPFYGSIISALNQFKTIPQYIKLNRLTYDKASWLGPTHNGYEPNGELDLNVPKEKFLERFSLLRSLDKDCCNWSDIREQGYSILCGDIAKAFKIDDENSKTKERYGENDFGKNLLVARRLIERGSKFISVVNYGWDMHGQIKEGFDRKGPQLDLGLSALIEDLSERGLSENCLIIVTTEFGRTSKINGTFGRDHQASITPLFLSGGNYQQGRIIGEHDDKAMKPMNKSLGPQDLLATIFDHFSIPKEIQKIDLAGRPKNLLEKGNCIL